MGDELKDDYLLTPVGSLDNYRAAIIQQEKHELLSNLPLVRFEPELLDCSAIFT